MVPAESHLRRSIRLKGYDYSLPGIYFVTICAADRDFLFGDVADGKVRLYDAGRIVQSVWSKLPDHYAGLKTDAFVVMPNHVHGILILYPPVPADFVGAGLKPAPTKRHPITEIVRGFKTFSARHINALRQMRAPVWQRNYYEHIIRNSRSLDRIRQYIAENPERWEFDRENPRAVTPEAKDAWARS